MNLEDEGPPIPVRDIAEARRARRGRRAEAEPAICDARVLRAAEVETETIEWLWHHRIPRGMLVILDGDPGLGKSTLTAEIGARVSRGDLMPGSPILALRPEPGGVLYLGAEDSASITVVPRLRAAGADLDRIGIYDVTADLPDLESHLDRIERDARALGAHLVVIDPLMAVLGGADAHKDQDVRRVLRGAMAMGARLGAAVLVVRHLNKVAGGSAVYRGGGSIGILGAARVGLLLARDPADPERRVLAATKTNLGPMPPSMSLGIVAAEGSTRIEWHGESGQSADDLVRAAAPTTPEQRSALTEARAVITQILADGPIDSAEAEKQAKAAGVAKRTFRRARAEMGVVAERVPGGPWRISLPVGGGS